MTETSWLGLEGRICVVTGAGGGLGRAIALGFAAAGARLVLLDRTAEAMDGTLAAARALGAAWPQAWVRATRLGGGSPPNDHAL